MTRIRKLSSPRGVATTLSSRFDPHRNSLNAVRLLLAGSVIVSHAGPATGRAEIAVGGRTLGGWSVLAFFVLSGFLITRSCEQRPLRVYFSDRALRILPGFVVALVATAFVFGPIGAAVSAVTWNLPDALTFVARNLLLYPPYLYQSSIGDMSGAGLELLVWNGPLYTLFYEGVCYVAVAVLMTVVPTRHLGRVLLSIIVLITAVAITMSNVPEVGAALFSHQPTEFGIPLGQAFMWGAVLWIYRSSVPLGAPLIVGAGLGLVACLALNQGFGVAVLPLSLGLMWLGTQPWLSRWGRRYDVSFGMYVYGWPVQTLLILTLPSSINWPVTADIAVVLAGTFCCAFVSCVLVEQPALRRKLEEQRVRSG